MVSYEERKTTTDKELIELFTKNALKSSNKERFDLLESNIKESKQRKNKDAGFMIGYSYRGEKINSAFDK